MAAIGAEDIRTLLQPGRVNRRVYTDPAIFDLEMEKIFGSAWIYVGHESQVRDAGDFLATRIGNKPLLLVRDAHRNLQLLHNQCIHRGSLVAASAAGHAEEFRCCYHGWTYHLDGRLKSVPLQQDYPTHFDARHPEVGLRRVARVASYRGFVFASLAPEGSSLEDYLGYMATSIDDMVDRAPDGEIEVAGGMFKQKYRGNWKLYLENLCDAAHPLFTHQSATEAAREQSDETCSDGSGEIALRQMRNLGSPYSVWEANVGIWTYPHGHSLLGEYPNEAMHSAVPDDPVSRDYIAAMEARIGKARTNKILGERRYNSNIYPSLSFQSLYGQLRVVHPISVNETVVHAYCFQPRGVPAGMFENAISYANIVNSPGSLVLMDDLEIFERIGLGLSSAGPEWLEIGRGYQSDTGAEYGGRRGKNSTSEIYIRNMFDAWLSYMTEDQGLAHAMERPRSFRRFVHGLTRRGLS